MKDSVSIRGGYPTQEGTFTNYIADMLEECSIPTYGSIPEIWNLSSSWKNAISYLCLS